MVKWLAVALMALSWRAAIEPPPVQMPVVIYAEEWRWHRERFGRRGRYAR